MRVPRRGHSIFSVSCRDSIMSFTLAFHLWCLSTPRLDITSSCVCCTSLATVLCTGCTDNSQTKAARGPKAASLSEYRLHGWSHRVKFTQAVLLRQGKAGTCPGLRTLRRLYEDSDTCPKILLIWLCARVANEALGKQVIAEGPTVPSCQRRAVCFLPPPHLPPGCTAMNRDKTREHRRPNSQLCFCNCCEVTFVEISQWQEDIQYCIIPNNPWLQECFGNVPWTSPYPAAAATPRGSLNWGCSGLLQWVKLSIWCRDLENTGMWPSLNYSVFVNIGQSGVSDSWSPIGIIKNIPDSFWTHYRPKFWRGRCWDLLPFFLEVCRLSPWREWKLPSPSKSWETRGALPPNLSYLPALPSNFSVLHLQHRYVLRFAVTVNCFILTLPRVFLQQRSGSP